MVGQNKKRLLRLFRNADSPLSAQDVAQELGISKNAARQWIFKLHKEGLIVRETRGFYRDAQAPTLHEVQISAPLQVHGLQISTEIKDLSKYEGIKRTVLSTSPDSPRQHKNNYSTTLKEQWEGRILTLTFFDSVQSIKADLRSSNNPLGIPEFLEFCGYLQGRSSLPLKAWKVTNIGLNYDYAGLRMDGIKSLNLDVAKNTLFKIYNHKEVLRVEAHTSPNIPLNEVLHVLQALSDSTEQTIRQQVAPAIVSEELKA